jgi:hypothetical protein
MPTSCEIFWNEKSSILARLGTRGFIWTLMPQWLREEKGSLPARGVPGPLLKR